MIRAGPAAASSPDLRERISATSMTQVHLEFVALVQDIRSGIKCRRFAGSQLEPTLLGVHPLSTYQSNQLAAPARCSIGGRVFVAAREILACIDYPTFVLNKSAEVRRALWRYIAAEPPAVMPRNRERWRFNPNRIRRKASRSCRRKHLRLHPTAPAGQPKQRQHNQCGDESEKELRDEILSIHTG